MNNINANEGGVTMQIESVFLIIHVHTLDQEILKRSYNDSKEEY